MWPRDKRQQVLGGVFKTFTKNSSSHCKVDVNQCHLNFRKPMSDTADAVHT